MTQESGYFDKVEGKDKVRPSKKPVQPKKLTLATQKRLESLADDLIKSGKDDLPIFGEPVGLFDK